MMMLSILLTYIPDTSYACSCVPPDSVTEELERHTAVFSGKVVEMVDENKFSLIQSSADLIAVTFEVEQSWKGINQPEVVVQTERNSASCGYEFNIHNDYLVYANEVDGELRVSLCSRTAPLADASQDIEQLGIGEKPVKQDKWKDSAEQTSNDLTNLTAFYIYLFIIILILSGAYITIARRHKN